MKIFVTKYALTEGILEMEAEEPKPEYKGMVTVKGVPGKSYDSNFHGEGREWHRDMQSARAKATKMVQAKIASLKKQIVRLDSMVF
jgi:hypothetical protein